MAILTLIRCPRRASLIKLEFWRILARLLKKNEASEIHHGGRKVRGWRTSLPFSRAGRHIVTEALRIRCPESRHLESRGVLDKG